MSNPYGGSGYPGAGNNPPSGSTPGSPTSPSYGGGNYGGGSYGSGSPAGGPSAPSSPGSGAPKSPSYPGASSAPSAPSSPAYPGASNAPSAPGGPSYPGGSGGSLGPSGGSSAKNGIGLWAMILGLGGIIFGILTGLPGAIMGAIGLKNVNNGEADNKGQAITGLIAGIVTSLGGLIGGIIVVIMILTGSLFASAGGGGSDPAPVPNEPTQGSQDPGSNNQGPDNQGSGSGGGSSTSGTGPEIASGVKMNVATTQVTAGPYAIPAEVQGKRYMLVEITFTNNSSQDFDLRYPIVSAATNGQPVQEVLDSDTQPDKEYALPSTLKAGDSAKFQTGFMVDEADVTNTVVTIMLGNDKYEFQKK